MARDFGPFPSKPMYEVVNRRMQRALAEATSGTGFVRTGQGAVTAGTGAQLVIAAYPDGALVDGLYVENAASETVTLTTNTNTNPRIDRLVLRLDMAAETIAPFQIVGTPAASPSVPPLVQTATTYDMPLCRYTFPGSASAQNPGSIVDERISIGTDWQTYTPAWTVPGASTQPTIGNGVLSGRYLRLGRYAGHFEIQLTLGSTTGGGNGSASQGYQFSLPPGWTHGPQSEAVAGYFLSAVDTGGLTAFVSAGDTKVYEIRASQNNSIVGNGLLTATGNYVILSGTIELA